MQDRTNTNGETPLSNPYSEAGCFFCGPENPAGPHLRFFRVEGERFELVARWTPDERYRGLGQVLHGGIQAGMLDEIMGWTAHQFSEGPGVTAEMRIKYLGPLYIGNPLELRCWVEEADERKVHLHGVINDHENKLCAEAFGVYVMMSPERFTSLVGSDL